MELLPRDIQQIIQNYVHELKYAERTEDLHMDLIGFFKQARHIYMSLFSGRHLGTQYWKLAVWVCCWQDKVSIEELDNEDWDTYNEHDHLKIQEELRPKVIVGAYHGIAIRKKKKKRFHIYGPCF